MAFSVLFLPPDIHQGIHTQRRIEDGYRSMIVPSIKRYKKTPRWNQISAFFSNTLKENIQLWILSKLFPFIDVNKH